MKRIFLLMTMLLSALATSVLTEAQTVYFEDGFENGLKDGWTQMYFDRGQWTAVAPQFSQPWKTETGNLLYPDNAAVGNGRAYFRNESKDGGNVQTAGYKTRLITPLMDLSSGYQPILRFYHAQAKWTADFDTLRVYYRQGQGTKWELLRAYTSSIQHWTFEEIDLPMTGKDYQLAFEANENMGRGIVLDSVLIRTKPEITTPHDIEFYDIRDNGMNIQWQASKDADNFRIAVFTESVDLNVNPSDLSKAVLDSVVESDVLDIRMENIVSGMTYYVQVRSIGETENSVWSNVAQIYIKPVVQLPYTEKFDLAFKSESEADQKLLTWIWGSSQGGYTPIMPLWIGGAYFSNYSVDATSSVAFIWERLHESGNMFTNALVDKTTIPAGSYQYIASPEISGQGVTDFSLSKCHVTFWGTAYTLEGKYAKSIIVGVMTDPQDVSTFVPVTTCTISGYKTQDFFDVDLSGYNGNGRYVAFMSNFTEPNAFFLDNVTIELMPAVGNVMAKDIKVVTTTSSATLSWPAVRGADAYDVKYIAIAKDAAVPALEMNMPVTEVNNATTNSFTATGLTADCRYLVSVRAKSGETYGQWSQPKTFNTSVNYAIPMQFTFEDVDGGMSRWLRFGNASSLPSVTTASTGAHWGSSRLVLKKTEKANVWVVAPYIADLSQIEMSLYTNGGTLEVGVMEDIHDANSFTLIKSMSSGVWTLQTLDFTTYTGNGHYIALRPASGTVNVDDVSIREKRSVVAPEVSITNITDNSFTASWTAVEGATYNVKVSTIQIEDSKLTIDDSEAANKANFDGLSVSTITVNDLHYATSYYLYIQMVNAAGVKSYWSSPYIVHTNCPTSMSLPYTYDFDKDVAATGSVPTCWTPALYGVAGPGVYAYVNSTYRHTAPNSLQLYSSANQAVRMALPKMDGDLSELKLSFWYMANTTSTDKRIIVGLTSNPSAWNDWEAVDTITLSRTGEWEECMVGFGDRTGTDKYIAFTTFTGTSGVGYIDDISVTSMRNAAPFNIRAYRVSGYSLTVGWNGKTTDKWVVLASKNNYDLVSFDPAAGSFVANDTVSENKVVLNDLEPLTQYYFYIKSTEGTEWGKAVFKTEFTADPHMTITEDFESYGNNVTSTLYGSNASQYKTSISHYSKAKIPQNWYVGCSKGTDPSKATSNTTRYQWPYVVTDGYVSSSVNNYSASGYGTKAVKTNYKYSSSTKNSLRMYSSSTAVSPVWAAMPKLDCLDDELLKLVISGNVKAVANKAVFEVGLMDDPADISTFTPLAALTLGKGINNTPAAICPFSVSTVEYTGSGRYVAFRIPQGKTADFYLDDIKIEYVPCLPPDPSIGVRTDTTAVLVSGARTGTLWRYIVLNEEYDPEKLTANIMPDAEKIVIPVTEFRTDVPQRTRLSHLTPNTTYYVYVGSMCSEADSEWRGVSFKTLCSDADGANFIEDFESYATASGSEVGCWIVGNTQVGAAATYIPYTKDCSVLGGTKALQLSAHKTSGMGAYAITQNLAFPEGKSIRDYQLEFDAFGSNNATTSPNASGAIYVLKVGFVDNATDFSTYQGFDTITLGKTAQHYILPLNNYTGEGQSIVFLAEIEGSATYNYAWIDNVQIKPLATCAVPTNIEMTDATDTTLSFSWNGNAAQYRAILTSKQYAHDKLTEIMASDSAIAAEGIILETTNENKVTFSKLSANTSYYIYVQGVCSADDRSEWLYNTIQFKTECPAAAAIPFTEDFESYASGATPDCYTILKSVTPQPKVSTTAYNSTRSFGCNIEDPNQYVYLITPAMDVADMADLQVSFALYQGYDGPTKLYVGLVEDPSNVPGTFHLLTTCTPTKQGGWEEFNLLISQFADAPTTTHKHVGFYCSNIANDPIINKQAPLAHRAVKGGGGEEAMTNFYIDNIMIVEAPSCMAPSNVTATNVGYTNADISFKPLKASHKQWEVRFAAEGDTAYYITDTCAFTYNALKPTRKYSVSVRTICSDTENSEWTMPTVFWTKFKVDNYKWTFTMDEQGTTSVVAYPGSTLATYPIHPAFTTYTTGNGVDYTPYQIANTSQYAYANDPNYVASNTERAMRLNSGGYKSALILPLVNEPDSKQLSFDIRAGYAYASTYSTIKSRNVVASGQVNEYAIPTLSIGVIDSAASIDTYSELTRWQPAQLIKSDTLKETSNYGWVHVILPLSEYSISGKQLTFMISGTTSPIFLDNVAIEPYGGFATPYLMSVVSGDKSCTLNWTGNAEGYNVYMIDISDTTLNFFPYLQDANPRLIHSATNVTGNTYTFDNLKESTQYAFYVEDAAHAGQPGALSNRRIAATSCAAVEARSYEYGFEYGPNTNISSSPFMSDADGFSFQWPNSTTAGDTVYKTPDCWVMGMTYNTYDPASTTFKTYRPTMLANTTAYKYSFSGNSVLAFRNAGSSYPNTAYAVMPLLKNVGDDELVFYGRCLYENASNSYPTNLTYVAGTSYSTQMIVGTVTNQNDMTTFVPLDTVTWEYNAKDISTSVETSNDTTGLRYFTKFIVPLQGTQGKYIAFKQVATGQFYIDDIKVQARQTPRPVRNSALKEATPSSATVTWKPMETGGKFVVELSQSSAAWTNLLVRDTVTATEYTFNELQPYTQYYFRVRHLGTPYGDADFAHYASFFTECASINPNGYSTGFECVEEGSWMYIPGATSSMKQNYCWSYLNHTNNMTRPQNITNTSTYQYSHSGAWAMELKGSSNYNLAVVTPRIDAEVGVAGKGFDTLQVSFWARPGYHKAGVDVGNNVALATNNMYQYSNTIEIGTCTDPDDPATYTVLDTWSYTGGMSTNTRADATNDYLFRKVVVKLNGATGPYVFIRPSYYNPESKMNVSYCYMYFDDLKFQRLTNCELATDLHAEQVTDHSARLVWTAEGMSQDVEVSTDPTFTDLSRLVLAKDSVVGNAIELDNLSKATEYYFRVRNNCDPDQFDKNDWTQHAIFSTIYSPLYDERFTMQNIESDKSILAPAKWNRRSAYAKDVFAGGALDTWGGNQPFNDWMYGMNYAVSGGALYTQLYGTSESGSYYLRHWMISPSIYLGEDAASMTFDAALVNCETQKDITEDPNWNSGIDDQFMVIISTDNGKTWLRENATIWNNETSDDPSNDNYRYGKGDYRLTDIPAVKDGKGTQYMIDLAKYAGKTIRIALYAENTKQNAHNAIVIDNVHVNYIVTEQQTIERCQFEDIENVLGFNISGDTIPAGEHQFRRTYSSLVEGVKDSLFVLNVNYREAPQSNYEITVCEGTPFSYMGFNEHSQPGTYRMKLTSLVTGCDSIVNLTIRHTESFATTIDTTICGGSSISFDGKILTESGTYTAYLKAIGGCDSIVTMNLTVLPLDHTYKVDSIWHGEVYQWGNRTFTEQGNYDSTFVNRIGCDSIVTLQLLVKYTDVTYENAAICDGDVYAWRNHNYTATGTYYDTLRVSGQPDAIYGLMLVVNHPVETNLPTQTICKGDYIEFGGKYITETGEYVDTLVTVNHCDSVVRLHVIVNMPSENTINTSICHGSSYFFGSREITKSGTYRDTLRNAVGCDSVVTLNLTVNEPLRGTQFANFCAGGLYVFHGQTFTKGGIYEVTVKNEMDCDSIVTLTLTEAHETFDTLTVVSCYGETYRDENFDVTEPGTYFSEGVSEGGCAAHHVLYFSYMPGEISVDTTITTDQLPYDYNNLGVVVYGVETQPGVYNDKVQIMSEEGCGVTLNHKLTINKGTGLSDVNYNASGVEKIIINNALYIRREGQLYNAVGVRVDELEIKK